MHEDVQQLEQQLLVTLASPDPRARIDLLVKYAFRLREHERWDDMVASATEARQLAETCGYRQAIARSLGIHAFVRYMRSDYDRALADCHEAMSLADGDNEAQASIHTVLSLVLWSLGNLEEALRHCDNGRALIRDLDESINEAFIHTIRGGILHSLAEYEQALASHRRSLAMFRQLNYPAGVARALAGEGTTLLALGRIDEAYESNREGLELARAVDHQIGISRALNDLGETAEARGDFARALELHREALAIRVAEQYRQAEATSLASIGRVYRVLGEHAKAVDSFQNALAIAEEINARPKVASIHHALAELYESSGDLKAALDHFKAYEQAKAELARGQSALRHKALELEAQLEFARKDAEIHRLKNVELASLLEQLQMFQAQLINSEKMAALGGLVAGVAHEINSPLGVIRSSADTAVRCAERIVDSSSGRSAAAVEALKLNTQLIVDATRRIERLVDRLKSFAGIDQSDYTCFDLCRSLDDVVGLLAPDLGNRIEIERDFTAVPMIYGFAAEINQVLMHLMRNASQAIEGEGRITLRALTDPANIRVEIRDNGRGIPPDKVASLFTPGFSREQGRVRASLSLFTCQSIIQKHGGEIGVSSTLGEGSIFTIILPRDLEQANYPSTATSRASA